MGRMSADTRARVVIMWRAQFPVARIQARLREEGVLVSRKSIYLLVRKYQNLGSIADMPKPPRKKLLESEHFRFIDESMESNPELTSRHKENFSVPVSLSTVKRARQALGWGSKRSRYCALISEVNKEKRMTWCMDRVAEDDLDFTDVVWTDECSIQVESHRKIVYQKEGHPVRLAARPKHPPKIQVWGGISTRGATPIVIFTGNLIATRYTRILDAALLPFLEQHYPDGHRFQQDNDPKHTSRWAQAYFQQ